MIISFLIPAIRLGTKLVILTQISPILITIHCPSYYVCIDYYNDENHNIDAY